MYIISVLFRGKTIQEISTFISSSSEGWESFHALLYTFETSNVVLQFTVSDSGGKITDQKHFGFGNMEKWVSKFDYSRND